MPTSLASDKTLVIPAKSAVPTTPSKPRSDVLQHVPLELLDTNPWQPRSAMDPRELTELVDAIRAQGLIQPIAVKPGADGRFVIVAGHRRVEAFKRLHAEATTETQRQQFSAIAATVKTGLDDSQLAAQAYIENVARAGLTPVDEARALDVMLEKRLAHSTEELAELVQQPIARIKRLRRLSAAPAAVKDAVKGIQIESTSEAGPKREVRRLDLMAALAFIRLHEYLKKQLPKKADERVETAVRRALTESWSFKRCDDFVDAAIAGRSQAEAGTPKAPDDALFSISARRFAIDLVGLKEATEEQLNKLKAAVAVLIATRGASAVQR